MVDLALHDLMSDQRHRPGQRVKLQMWEPDRSRQPILVRTSCLRGCGPRAAWRLHRIDWTTQVPGCGLKATQLPGCRIQTSHSMRSWTTWARHCEDGTPASAGTHVQASTAPADRACSQQPWVAPSPVRVIYAELSNPQSNVDAPSGGLPPTSARRLSAIGLNTDARSNVCTKVKEHGQLQAY